MRVHYHREPISTDIPANLLAMDAMSIVNLAMEDEAIANTLRAVFNEVANREDWRWQIVIEEGRDKNGRDCAEVILAAVAWHHGALPEKVVHEGKDILLCLGYQAW